MIITAVVLISTAFFVFLSVADNRYNKSVLKPEDGVLILNDSSFEENPLIFLDSGWALYQGLLLTPVEIGRYKPDQYIHIGQYSDMSFGNDELSLHGSATYRLRIDVSGHEGDNIYTLQLPKIFSAYRLYINGELMQTAGNPYYKVYEPLIFTSEITFKAETMADIVFCVSDWSHYNSGITVPPAFGDTLAVNTMVQGGLVWRAAVIGGAFIMGLTVLLAGTLLDRKPGVLFLMLVLFFMGYISYNIIHALFPAGMFWFYFETFCFYAMFFIAIWLMGELCHIHNWLSMAVKVTDALMCLLSIAIPILFSGYHKPMYIFHTLTDVYKGFLMIYLTVISVYATARGVKYAPALLCGMSVFIVSFLVDLFAPARSPIVMGEFIELSCCVMVCIIGAILAHSAMYHHRRTAWVKCEEEMEARLIYEVPFEEIAKG